MTRPTKLTPEITTKIGDGVSLGLTYALAAESAGITYKTFNDWMKWEEIQHQESTLNSISILKNVMLMELGILLQRLNDAAEAGNCQVCMLIVERRFGKTLAGVCIEKQILFQRIKMKC